LLSPHNNLLNLRLNPQALPLFSTTYNAPNKLVIVEQSIQYTQHLTAHLNHLTQQLKLPDTWHIISGSLTKQELSGDICSTLSLGLHHFLSVSTHHHFVLPLALTALKLPNRHDYTANKLVWHRLAKVSQSVLIDQLTAIGYRRHRTSIEPGTFVVRGEQLLVKHPVQSGHYIITLYGPSLEKIEYYDNTRRHPLTKIILMPASFPSKQTTLDNLVSPFMIIRPAHAQLSGNPTVISNALQSDLSFPDIAIPLSMRPAPIKKLSTISRSSSLALLNRLQENKPAVHSDHGIGIYEGMKKRTINNYTKDYLILRYAAGDTLSVPVEYSFKVSPYLGDATPTIHRLGGNSWLKSRRHAQRDAVAFAQELLKNEALRQQSVRPHYHLEAALDDWLDKTFPYELTPDQASTWRDIQADLTSDTPMDRLVIGDVGFGKTELAIRATCHAINNQQQVALLAPTTILVQQHYDLFVGCPTWRHKLRPCHAFLLLLINKPFEKKLPLVQSQLSSAPTLF
jgi:transcription-repair coupling factor (superfamily II helicase)